LVERLLSFTCLLALLVSSHLVQGGSSGVTFKKFVVDKRFVAEGVAVGDVDRDGKLDILAGNVWYQAPLWKPHAIAPVTEVDPKHACSNCFNTWAADLNHDGWIDQIVIGMPGEKAIWRENPGVAPSPLGDGRNQGDASWSSPHPPAPSPLGEGRGGVPWKEHPIWRSAGNESPLYVDLFGNGKKVLIMGTDDAYLAWFEPAKDPYAEWVSHPVGELKGPGSQRYSHGLGVGDVDGDGRKEILTTGGYYTKNQDSWTLTKAELGPDCAQMLVGDVDEDKRPDVLTTSAHARGVWWFSGAAFDRNLIDETVSETHSANLVRLGSPPRWNLVTGKRKWAHPPGVDVGSEEPSWLVRYEFVDGRWVRHVIDVDSGVGTQFVVQDMDGNGTADIVVANKNGVFLFEGR